MITDEKLYKSRSITAIVDTMHNPKEEERLKVHGGHTAYYSSNISAALDLAQADNHHATSMPEFIQLKIDAPDNDMINARGYATTSREIIGKSDRKQLIVILHGCSSFNDPEDITTAVNRGLIQYIGAGKIASEEFNEFMSKPMKNNTVMYSMNEILSGIIPIEPFGIVLYEEDIHPSGISSISALGKNKHFIARIGNLPLAQKYLEYLAKKNNKYGNTHALDTPGYFNIHAQPHFNLLYLLPPRIGIDSTQSLLNPGRFVSIPTKLAPDLELKTQKMQLATEMAEVQKVAEVQLDANLNAHLQYNVPPVPVLLSVFKEHLLPPERLALIKSLRLGYENSVTPSLGELETKIEAIVQEDPQAKQELIIALTTQYAQALQKK